MNNNLACLFLPLFEKNILLPSAAVAEIVSYEKPQVLADVPAWFLGVLTWRGIQIPLVNLEEIEPHTAWHDTQLVMEPEANKNPKSNPETKLEESNYRIAVLNRIYKLQESELGTDSSLLTEKNLMSMAGDLQSAEKKTKYPFFAVLLKRNPKLYRISNSDLHLIKESEQDVRYKMEVKVITDNAFIPNLANLWGIIDALPSRLQWFRQIIM